MPRYKFTQPNPPAISLSSLKACFEELKKIGPVKKSQVVRMLNSKSSGSDSILLRFESAGLLLAEDPITGEVRAWE